MSRPLILIIEDDRSLSAMMGELLQENGMATLVEERGDRAPARILATRPDLVILDVMLPGMDGLSVCRAVRDDYLGRILVLTARGDEVDEVLGLELGADDYLAKPVRPRVLLARVRAVLRRPEARPPAHHDRISLGDLCIDPGRREARFNDVPVPLTSGELDLLLLLVKHAGKPLERRQIYLELRGASYDELDRSIDLMVSRLRQKLQAASGRDQIIKTVRGVGYLFVAA